MEKLHKYRPELEKGNAAQFITQKALPYLKGKGLDVGYSQWKIKKDAIGVDLQKKPGVDLVINNWNKIPSNEYDYIFSSHCLEHILDWENTLQHWVRILKTNGILFIYLPNPAVYNRWSKKNMKPHKHDFKLPIIARKLTNLNIKITDKGHDEFAGMWATGVKKYIKLFL